MISITSRHDSLCYSWLIAAACFSGSVCAQTPDATAGAQQSAASGELEEVVVTGTHLPASGYTSPIPVTVLDASTLEDRAPANVLEVINQLPDSRPTQQTTGNTRGSSGQATGVQGLVDLRGLGVSRTLGLVDGERFVGSPYSGQLDTNMIPTSLIDHVDIVKGGASAAYGSDAVAGVVNFVLKDRMEGITGSIQGGESIYRDDKQIVASLGAGTGFAGGHAHIVFGFDYANNGGEGNIYSRPYGSLEPGLIGTGAVGSATRPAGTPANVWTNGVEDSSVTNGGIITSGALKGVAFDPAGNPYNFNYGSVYGSTMIGSTANYGNNPQGYFTLGNAFERQTYYTKFSYDLPHDTTVFATAQYGNVDEQSLATGPLVLGSGAFTINNTNPYIPASVLAAMAADKLTTITVGKIFDVGGTHVHQDNFLTRFTLGARGLIFGNWNWDAYFEHGQSDEYYGITGMREANILAAADAVIGANGAVTCAPIASNPNFGGTNSVWSPRVQPGCVPFNIFGNAISPAAYNYMFGTASARIDETEEAGAVNLRGSPVSDWAGPISLATGAEMRYDRLRSTGDPASTADNSLGLWAQFDQADYYGNNGVVEGYVETGVPLAQHLGALVKAVNLDAAARVTGYRDGGTVDTWKLGLTYDVDDELRLRASQSQDIRMANLYELHGANPPAPMFNTPNPFTGQVQTVLVSSVGNPNLTPEIAHNTSAGIVFQPAGSGWLPGFRASLDYFQVRMARVIASVSLSDTINGCFAGDQTYCSNISFGPGNVINSVFTEPSNIDHLFTNGLDIEAEYQIPKLPVSIPGSLDIRILGTYTRNMILQTAVSSTNYAGSATAAAAGGGVPHERGDFTITYALAPITMQFQFSGFSSILYNPADVGPNSAAYNPNLANSISRNLFPGMVYVNWTGTYNLPLTGDKSLQFFGVVNNLFNHTPPAYALNAFSFNEADYYDVIGQTFEIGARFRL
jgi:outer membrane receptor protein involved in Fe transport